MDRELTWYVCGWLRDSEMDLGVQCWSLLNWGLCDDLDRWVCCHI